MTRRFAEMSHSNPAFAVCVTRYRHNPASMVLATDKTGDVHVQAGDFLEDEQLGIGEEWERRESNLVTRETYTARNLCQRGPSDHDDYDREIPGDVLEIEQIDGDTVRLANAKITEIEAITVEDSA